MKQRISIFLATVVVALGAGMGGLGAQTSDLFNLTDTWNDGPTTFDSIKMVVTDTASATDSDLLDMSVVGGASFGFDKYAKGRINASLEQATGNEVALTLNYTTNKATSGDVRGLRIVPTSTAVPGVHYPFSIEEPAGTNTFRVEQDGTVLMQGNAYLRWNVSNQNFITKSGTTTRIGYNTTPYFDFVNATNGGVRLYNSAYYGWGSSGTSTPDLFIYRDAANTLAQRNGVNGQTFRVYTTYTDLNNRENLAITGSAITVETAGTGTDDIDLTLTPAGAGGINLANFAELTTGYTVATLPGTPAVGMIARVTDALTPSLGATVTGGGAEDALVWYDGAAWVVVSGESGIGGGGGLANVVEDTTPQLGGQLDINGQSFGDGTLELLSFSETVSAVNEFTITNAATGNGPILSATGGDTDVDINITPKGAGSTNLNGKTAHPFGGALTLSAGVVTATDSYHEITSQSGPNDDLDTISGGVDGMILVLHPTTGDTITVKDGTGNIKCATDFAMNAIEDSIMLIYSSAQSAWIEISRSDNG